MSRRQWYKVARKIVKAGIVPVPVGDSLINLLKELITEEQMDFLQIFTKSSLTIEQISVKTELDDDSLHTMLNNLMDIGMVTGIPSRSTGEIIYRLVAFLPGLLEFTLMKGETGEKQRKLARLWEKLFKEIREGTYKNYDKIMEVYKSAPPIGRIIPVEEEIEIEIENVLPFEEITKIVDKYEVISLSYCYCRHQKELLEDPCKLNAPKLNCIGFGRSAQFCIDHNFATQISKEEAIRIFKEAENCGLVHRVFHVKSNPELDELAICNCCKCCCGAFRDFYSGGAPTHILTSYIANIRTDDCLGCRTCVEKCPMETIELIDTIAQINEARCIGCGICVHYCPENAIILKRTGIRNVFVPAPRMKSN